MVRDPKLLILDDSLASIDVKTSAEIIYELRKAKAQCTSIIVSQRMTAVQHADEAADDRPLETAQQRVRLVRERLGHSRRAASPATERASRRARSIGRA